MEQAEALKLKKKKVRLVLSSSYRYSGKIITVNVDTLILNDKFGNDVSIKLSDISVCEVLDGD